MRKVKEVAREDGDCHSQLGNKGAAVSLQEEQQLGWESSDWSCSIASADGDSKGHPSPFPCSCGSTGGVGGGNLQCDNFRDRLGRSVVVLSYSHDLTPGSQCQWLPHWELNPGLRGESVKSPCTSIQDFWTGQFRPWVWWWCLNPTVAQYIPVTSEVAGHLGKWREDSGSTVGAKQTVEQVCALPWRAKVKMMRFP
ncbi:hypothetical protein Bbelb_411600 [Branchiostoma belcheri]|nr:hypothetical protein Bbelb_411600 [Branchiostoma belcheri]